MARLTRLLLVLFILASLASCGTTSSDGDQAARGLDVPAVGAGEPESSGQEALPFEPGEEREEGELGGGAGSGGEPGGGPDTTGQCTRCARRARLEFDASQGETGWEDWNTCMAENMPYETMDPQDPAFEDALDACEQYEPEGGGGAVMNPSSIRNFLAGTATTSCFHMTTGLTEYEFTYSWETGLEGEFREDGKPYVTELGLEMEFRGEPQETIHAWLTKSTLNKVSPHYWFMFKGANAELRKDLPLEEMLWKFEKTPDSCEIEPDKDEVEPEEKIEVQLTDFVDIEGEGSREFNRILVDADEGTIHGGTPLKVNPNMHVFVLGDGEITFTYEAPDSTEKEEDTIRVYSSCEILTPKEQPLEETWTHEQIANKTIRIKRPTGWTGTITGSRLDTDSYSDTVGDSTVIGSWTAGEDISIRASLQYEQAGMIGDMFTGTSDGTYSLSFEKTEEIYTEGQLFATRKVSIHCGGALDPDPTRIHLDWDKQRGTYEIDANIYLPVCEGTEETVLFDGSTMVWEAYSTQHFLGEGAPFYWRGTTDGKTITGTAEGAGKTWTYTFEYHGE